VARSSGRLKGVLIVYRPFVSGPITAEVMAGVLVHVYLELSASLLLSASVDYTAFGRPHFL
jgi:hypothetical protein